MELLAFLKLCSVALIMVNMTLAGLCVRMDYSFSAALNGIAIGILITALLFGGR